MHILYSAPTDVVKSHTIEIVNNFAQLGHRVHLVTFWKDKPKLHHHNINWYKASIRNRRLRQIFDINLWEYSKKFAMQICTLQERNSIDSLQTTVLRKLISNNDIDLIYERFSVGSAAIEIGTEFGVPIIMELNGIWPVEALQKGFSQKYCNEVLRQELDSLSKATSIRAVSKGVKEFYVDHGIDAAKFKVIGNGANVDLFRPMDQRTCREQLGFRQDEKIIGFIGSFQFYVGLEYVISALPLVLKKVSKARFFLIGRVMPNGAGPSLQELRSLAGKLGVEKQITLAAACPYEDVPRYVNAFDVCLAPRLSGTRQSPLKLHEYMACAKPIISSNVIDSEDLLVVEKACAGLLAKPESPEDLADKIVYLLTHEEEACQMGERGRRYAVENKSWRKITEQILNLMEEIMY